MLDKLLNFISVQKLFQPEDNVLLAVSGGLDSMVMVDLFHKAGFNYAIAHCNFHLRGAASDGDQEMVKEQARKLGVACFIKSFETEKYGKFHGISIQMAARDLRRSWFEELIQGENYQYISTAHHLNDSLETAIFNLTKGTGLAGLKGIQARNGHYIRPLMFTTRDMIHDYAKANGISWREDKSNNSVKYHRNLIRHEVIPRLKKINPRIEETFMLSSEKLAASEQILNTTINESSIELLENSNKGFKIAKVNIQSHKNPAFILFRILEPFGFNFSQMKDLSVALSTQPGKIILSESHKITIDRNFIFIDKKEQENKKIFLVDKNESSIHTSSSMITFNKVAPNQVNFTKDNNIAFFAFDKLKFPLKIRAWVHGDRFWPLGMNHKKKLSDFMIDEKIPLNLKKHVLVLTSEENIVWVIGYRIDDRYKITEGTKIVYKVCNIINDDKSV